MRRQKYNCPVLLKRGFHEPYFECCLMRRAVPMIPVLVYSANHKVLADAWHSIETWTLTSHQFSGFLFSFQWRSGPRAAQSSPCPVRRHMLSSTEKASDQFTYEITRRLKARVRLVASDNFFTLPADSASHPWVNIVDPVSSSHYFWATTTPRSEQIRYW